MIRLASPTGTQDAPSLKIKVKGSPWWWPCLWMLGASTSLAAGGYPWKNHAVPYTFKFGNHIDTHQQTKVSPNGELFGFLDSP